MRAAVTVQKNVRSVLNRKLVRVAQQGKQGRAEHFASTRIAVKWRVFRAKQDVARRRAERETEARVQAEEGYGEARTALAIEAAAELLSAVARLQVGGRSGCSRMYTAAYTHRMTCSMSICTHQVGESERLVDIAGRPAACILRRAGHYLVMNDNERLPERKVAFDKVAGLCSQFRLEGGEAGEAEAAERKTPGAKLQRRWSTNTPSAVERWTTQLDEKGRAHKDTEGEGEGEEEGEEAEAEAVRQAVRRARGRRAKEALMEEATRKAVEEERFLVRQPLEEATRKVVETQAEVRAVAAEAQAAGVLARAAVAEAEGRVDTAEAEAEARAMRAMAVEAQAAGTLARAAVAEAQRKTVEAKAEAQAEARAVAAEAQARAAEALARAAVAEAQLKTEAAKAETQAEARAMVAEAQAAEALARVAVAEAQARAAVAEARALTAEAEGRIGTLDSQASRSSLTPQHPSTSAVQLQKSGMVELGRQVGSAISELAPRQLGFSAEGTEPDAAAPLAAAKSDVGERAQEVARLERAIATARDANLLEPHEIAVRPTRDSPARRGTARHCPAQPVGASGGMAGEEGTGCAQGRVVKGAVRPARGRRRRQSSRRASKKWRSCSEKSYSPPPPPPALACRPRKRRR